MTFAALVRFLSLVLLPALAIAACGGGGEPSGEEAPLTGELREMLDEVAAARGLEAPTDLRVQTVAPEDVVDVYTGLIDEESREALQEGGALYQLLGYIEPGETYWDVTVSTAGLWTGFYSYEDKTLWVVTEEDDVDLETLSDEERATLAHEMLHALQDHNFGLRRSGSRTASTLDGGLAWRSVVEGDAMLSMSLWRPHTFLRPAGGVDGPVLLLANVGQEPMDPQIERALLFPYISGEIAMRRLVDREGVEALNQLYDLPPPSTAHILHSHLLGSDWLPESVSHLLPVGAISQSLGSGWTEMESGVLGEFHLVNYLLGKRPGYPWHWGTYFRAEDAGEGWRGDYYRLFQNDEELVLVVVARFESDPDAREFEYVHQEALRGEAAVEGLYTFVTRDDGYVVARIAPVGRTVFFAIGTSAEVARAALAPLVGG